MTSPGSRIAVIVACLAAPAVAHANCEADARAAQALAKAETNEIARRAALADVTLAMDEAGDLDEAACQRYVARARDTLRDKPFRLDPGQTLGSPNAGGG